MDDMRKAFEAWQATYEGGSPWEYDPDEAWQAWQAATMAERERCALVADNMWHKDGIYNGNVADAIRGEWRSIPRPVQY